MINRRLSRTIFVSQSLFSAAQIAIVTLLSITAVDLSGTESAAGVPTTTATFSQALMAVPIGIFMGRVGRRLGLSLSYSLGFVAGIVGLVAIYHESFGLLLGGAALAGLARAGADQSRFAAAEVYPLSQRAKVIGWIVFAGTIGAIVGPSLVAPSGWAVEQLGLDENAGVWAAGGILYGMAALITFTFLRPDPMEISRALDEAEQTSQSTDVPARALRQIFQDPRVQLAMLAMLISQAVMVSLMVITPVHMNHYNYGNGEVSIVFMAHTIGMFGLSGVTGWFIDRYGRVNMILAGAVTLLISAILAPLNSAMPVLILALFLLGLGWNFGYIAGSSLLADALNSAERGRIQGINDALVATFAGVGSLSSGPLFEWGGYVGVSLMGIVLVLFLTGMIGNLSPRQAGEIPA